MGMSYPPPLMIAGARCVLDCLWMDGKGRLPKNLDRIYAAARAYSDQERAAVCIALQEYFPDQADQYRLPSNVEYPEVP